MTLKDQMADDLANVFLNADEFAAAATVTLRGESTTFALTVTPGDVVDSYSADGLGTTKARETVIVCQRSAWRDGTLDVLGTGNARDPIRGDALALTEQGYAGTWYVRAIATDVGDGLTLTCTDSEHEALGGEDVVEVL